MKYKKLNYNWNADPNAPYPQISVNGKNLILTFYLNYFLYENFSENDLGILQFSDWYLYKLDNTNDEGFYNGEFRISPDAIKWGEFYELEDSNWESDFPKDAIKINNNVDTKNLKHYLFFFRDETFECIAKKFTFKVEKAPNKP